MAQKKKEIKQNKKQKEPKVHIPKIQARTVDLLPFVEVEDGIFKTKIGYMDIFQLESKDIYSLNEDEMNRSIWALTTFLRSFSSDIKFIAMNFPVNTSKQQEYVRRKIQQTNNPLYKEFLQDRLEELVFLEKRRTNREYFVAIYPKTRTMYEDQVASLQRGLQKILPIIPLTEEKKRSIVFKLNNQNSKVFD